MNSYFVVNQTFLFEYVLATNSEKLYTKSRFGDDILKYRTIFHFRYRPKHHSCKRTDQ